LNYLAHGYRFVDRPWFLAGTAIPDWLGAADRRVRVRSKQAEPFTHDADDRLAELASGILQHHADDAWFHETNAFVELSMKFTFAIRGHLPADDRFRPGFLGHISVELLLDSVLAARSPGRLDAYYQAVSQVDPETVQEFVNRMASGSTSRLARLIGLFKSERFLDDYATDDGLLMRLNHVMLRVGLETLPDSLLTFLAEAREVVTQRADELLTPSDSK
jgi:hypothetical protein